MRSSGYFTRISVDVMGVNLKFSQEKVKEAIAM